MLLLLVGLVVIVLIILVVVFLSVRSMRAAEADDERVPDLAAAPGLPDPRTARRPDVTAARNGARERHRGRGRDTTRTGGHVSDWGSVSDEQFWAELSSDRPLAATARAVQPGTEQAAGAPHSHKEGWQAAPAAGTGGEDGSMPQQEAPHGGPERDWSEGSSTEQFSLRPRSARHPRGSGARERDPADPGAQGRPAQQPPWEKLAPPAAGTRDDEDPDTDPGVVPVSWPSGSPAQMPGPDTGEPAWQPAPRGNDRSWDPPEPAPPSRPAEPVPAGAAPEPAAARSGPQPSWPQAEGPQAEAETNGAADDPLTSPSFAIRDAPGLDSRSYGGSRGRARPQRGGPGDVPISGYHPAGSGSDTTAGWPPNGEATAGYRDPPRVGHQQDRDPANSLPRFPVRASRPEAPVAQDAGGWRRGPDTGTQAGLDPGRPATEASGWYPAPALQADPWTGRRYGADGRDRAGEAPADPGRSWAADDRGAGDPSGSPPGTPAAQSSGHDSGGDGSAGYGATAAGDDTAGHGAAANDTAGYAPAGYGPSQETWGSRNGHASRDHAAQGSDYRPGPAGARHAGYASGDHPAGGAGYQNGHSGSAYAQHEDGNSGYRPARTEHDGPDNETDPGPGGTGYAPLPYGDDARYGQEPYGQAPYYAGPFRNSYDQEPGYGDYPDYDGRR